MTDDERLWAQFAAASIAGQKVWPDSKAGEVSVDTVTLRACTVADDMLSIIKARRKPKEIPSTLEPRQEME